MPDDEPAIALPRPRRRWVKRFFLGMLAVVALLLAFHRPLILRGGRWLAIHFAEKAGLSLDLRLGGTIYDQFTINQLSATATGPGTLRHLQLGSLEVRYSLPDLIHHGMPDLLKAIVVRDVKVVLDSAKAAPSPPSVSAPDSGPLQIPAWLPGLIELHDIDITAKDTAGDTQVQGLTFTLLPDRPGELKFARLTTPATGTMEKVSATTQFRDKNFLLGGLSLGPELRTEIINVDASRLDQDEIGLQVRGEFFGGHVSLASSLHNIRKAATAGIELQVDDLSLVRAGDFVKMPLRGSLHHAALKFSGDPTAPATWAANGDVEVTAPGYGSNGVDKATLALKLASSRLEVTSAKVIDDSTELTLDATAILPATLGELAKAPVQGHFKAICPDLAELAAKAGATPVNGKALVQGTFDLTSASLGATVTVDGENLDQGGNQIAKSAVKISLSKKLPAQAVFFEGLESTASVKLEGVQSSGYKLESVTVEATSKDAKVELTSAEVKQQGNVVLASGSYILPQDLSKAAQGQAEAKFSIAAPNLAAFAPDLSGTLETTGTLTQKDGQPNGNVHLTGKALRFRQFSAQQAQAEISLAGKEVLLSKLAVQLQGEDFVQAQGKASLTDALPYSGSVTAKVHDLSAFQSLVIAAGRAEMIAGSLDLNWKGSGEVKPMKHSGDISLAIHQGLFGDVTAIETEVAGTYSPELVDMPKLAVSSSLGGFSTHVSLRDSKLAISDFVINQGAQQFATAQILVPLDLTKTSDPQALVPPDAPVSVHIVSNKLDLKRLADQFHLPPQGSGFVTGTLDASGSLNQLTAALNIQGRELQSPAVPQVQANFDLDLKLKDNRFTLKAAVTKPDFLPLSITGTLPFDLQRTIADKKLKLNTPLDVAVKMPKSSMSFVSKFVPAIRYVEGDAAVDFKVAGTLEKPVFSGDASLNLPAVRFTDSKTPALAEVRAALAFAKDDLVINQLRGEIGGGPFNVTGKIKLAKPAEPDFDLTVKADHLAVMRNNSLTVRVNTDLKIAGPLKAGVVSGTIGVVDSRFFRDVDILPIGLPGRPTAKAKKPAADRPVPPVETASAASSPSGGPPFSLGPPLNNWKFDVKIRSDTPFLVRGNLANGAADIDLTLTGPGSSPALNGVVKLAKLAATLPFSRLDVESGYVYFTPETGINPRLDVQATSQIRSYTVHIYISGPADNPQTSFSSEPPLAQEDIVALLATGTTTKELSGSPDILAGRAAALVFQKLYHKVFKKNEDTEQKSVLDRFQVDTAGVGRDGSQAVNTTFSLSDNFQLVGQLDLEGNVGGQIKYVMRFK